ncbi:Com family DNA-binding transcriptional regulator [Clostridium botulinum]|nr:Com family DNA-binding transcriptional regulator [Clostridium botulinum]MBY6816471.1 Com family DNA-binding transcriptional regulator [Clostridium botulinum]MBY6827274.1 Com family DNA-binding transcriptional regulator [Clostridium botulinum]MBY6859222.1 Com family DNA-binding transcriptional regulator [Clostridium botulinum]MBY7041494.1 Com family DNA-binding transcriptional regulator [Clostridium botulinum]
MNGNRGEKMNDIRCPKCNQLLFKSNIEGQIEIKCVRCKNIIKLEINRDRANSNTAM